MKLERGVSQEPSTVASNRAPVVDVDFLVPDSTEAEEAEHQPTGGLLLILALVFAVLAIAGSIVGVLRPETFAWVFR